MSFLSLNSLKKYIVSVLISILATFVILALTSVVFSFFPPALWLMRAVTDYSYIFPVFISAFLSARASSGKGLLTGIVAALLCLVFISVTGKIFFNSANVFVSFFKILPIGVICGGLGGILGINSK